eukprot:gene18788-25329_t
MSQDVAALFKSYEIDYSRKSTDIARKISSISSLSGELRRVKNAEVEQDIKSAETVIKSMELEARSLPADASKPLLLKVKDYKADMIALKDQLKRAATSASTGEAARAELETGANILINLHGQRETIVRSRETLAGADDSISKARRILSGMARRALQHKIIMFAVAGFLLLGIILIIWAKVKN